MREQNYGKDQKKKHYYDLPDDREIPHLASELCHEPLRHRGFAPLPPAYHSPPLSPLRSRGGVSPPRLPSVKPLPPSLAPNNRPSALERDMALMEARELLKHASTCLRRQRESANSGSPPPLCLEPHCGEMKAVLAHLPSCTAGLTCTFQHCLMAKGIIKLAKEEDMRRTMRRLKEGAPEITPSSAAGAPTKPEGSGNGVAGSSEGSKPTGQENGATGSSSESQSGSGSPKPGNGVANGPARVKPKSQLEEYRERLAKEEKEKKERESKELNNGGGEQSASDALREGSKTENGAAGDDVRVGPVIDVEEPRGPVDVLGGILSSQAVTQELRRPAGPMVVDTKEGKVEVPAKSFANLQYRGVQYSVGDFVYMRSERGGEPQVHRLERLFEQEGIRTVLARRFYRAKMETFHEPSRNFYEREVARSSLQEVLPISRVLSRCYVLPIHHYNTHMAEGIKETDTFVCEFTYLPKTRQWEQIEPGAFWKPPAGLTIAPREEPLGAKRMEEAQHLKKAKAKPINVYESEEKSDVLSGILGNFTTSSTKPKLSESPSEPAPGKAGVPGSDLLSGLLASQGLTVTKRSVPGASVTAQEAASYNSMFSL